MKKKNLGKQSKLKLDKTIITSLTNAEMGHMHGGADFVGKRKDSVDCPSAKDDCGASGNMCTGVPVPVPDTKW